MKNLKESILSFTEAQKWKELEHFLISNQTDAISTINGNIFRKEGTRLLNGVLKSLQCKTRESTDLKMKIYKSVLKKIKSNEDSNESENGKLVTVLLVHLESFPSDALLDLIDIYITHLKAGLPFYGRWAELLGKLLSTSVKRDDLQVDGSSMIGDDFQYHILKTICDCEWSDQTATTLLPVFKELNLPKEELSDVIQKLKKVLLEVPYQSVPPIVYHMILLGQGTMPGSVLEVLMNFFSDQEATLQKKQSQEDSEAIGEAMEDDRIEKNSMVELLEAQGTVVLHMTHLAQYDSQLVKEFLKVLKNTWLPKKIFTPFNLALALSLTQIDRYKDQIIDLLKSCVLKNYKIEEKRRKFLWLKEAFKDPLDLNEVMKAIVRNCSGGWDQVNKGLTYLCFSLLESGGGLKGETFQCQQAVALSSNVLPLVFKKEPRLASDILKQLSNLILTTSSPSRYIELFGRLVKVSPLVMLDHITLVRDLLEQLAFIPLSVSRILLGSILPLLKISMTLKDGLVIILRKMLFSKQVENRIVAVEGFLQILRHFLVLGVLPSSQASMSFSSTLSQISADVHTNIDSSTNEALCLELLGVLRRGFTQQSEVRSTLYKGLVGVTRANPKLTPNVLQLLHQHFSSFVDLNDRVLNPILLEKTVLIQTESVTLIEPFGDLLSCLSRCKTHYEQYRNSSYEDDETESLDLLNDICSTFDVLTEKLRDCSMDDLGFDNVSFLINTSNGKKNFFYAQIMVGVFDSLMEYNFWDDALKSESKMKQVLSLFKTQKKITDLAKEKSKPGKKAGEGSKTKGRPAAPKQTITFHSGLSLHLAVEMLSVSLTGSEDANSRAVDVIKGNCDLQLYLISVIDATIASIKDLPLIHVERLIQDLKSAARLLFKECQQNLAKDDHDDDEREINRVRHCLSTLHALVDTFIKYSKAKLPQIFREMTGKSASKAYEQLLFHAAKLLGKLLVKILQSPDPAIFLKDSLLLVQIIGLVTDQMASDSQELHEIQEMVNQLCKDYPVSSSQPAEALVHLLLAITDRVKASSNLSPSLAREIHFRLGDIEEDVVVEEAGNYKIVSDVSAPAVVTTLCQYCDHVNTVLEMTLYKLKASLAAGEKYSEPEFDKLISIKFAFTINALHEIFQSAIPCGTPQDQVIKTATRFYDCLSFYVRYYLEYYKVKHNPQMSERFEKMIHLCSTMLKENAFKMINYLHTTQAKLGTKGKTNTMRAMKESKLIPALVYSMERYETNLLQLTKKSKVNLMARTKITTSRDFRIVSETVQEALRRAREEGSDDEEEREESEEGEGRKDRRESESDEENSPPKKKKKNVIKK